MKTIGNRATLYGNLTWDARPPLGYMLSNNGLKRVEIENVWGCSLVCPVSPWNQMHLIAIKALTFRYDPISERGTPSCWNYYMEMSENSR